MENTSIINPIIAMAALTFWVTARLYLVQRRATKNREVKYGFFRVYRGEAPEYIQAARDHYKNMFELPVLFYVWAGILYTSGQIDIVDLVLRVGCSSSPAISTALFGLLIIPSFYSVYQYSLSDIF